MINSESSRTLRGRLLGGVLVAALVAAGGGAGYAIAETTGPVPPPLTLKNVTPVAGFSALVKTVRPAVVNISTEEVPSQSQQQRALNDPQFNEMLRHFFGFSGQNMFRAMQKPTHALGSGFVVDPHGYIATNNHVIDDATDIEVTFADGSTHRARVVGRDKATDIALLKVDVGHPLPYVSFGDSNKAQVGDWVVAVGNPYGLGGTVTAGIISGEKRAINSSPYDSFLQIDAPINPGNSGGPLFDQSGQVIGIDTAIFTPSGGSVGIGFAIPSDVARNVVDALKAHGHVTRGWLGVEMQELTPPLASALGLHGQKGVLVASVLPDSPAAHAGVSQGDVITAFNGKPVTSTTDLAGDVAAVSEGAKAGMKVLRNGQEHTLSVVIGKRSQQTLASAQPSAGQGALGLALAPLPPDQQSPGDKGAGVLVQDVTPGSKADLSGIQAGDVILKVGSQAVSSPSQAASVLRAAANAHRDAVLLLVRRQNATQYLALSLDRNVG